MTIGSLDTSARRYETLIEERSSYGPPSLGCSALEQSANTADRTSSRCFLEPPEGRRQR